MKYSLVETTPILRTDAFAWTKDLEANWKTIRQEAETVLEHRQAIPPLSDLSPDHRRLSQSEHWRSFFLWGYGFRVAQNCLRCPETAAIVSKIPGLRTAMFSIHAPGLHIPRHKGATASMLTCHLALKVPKDREQCRIAVRDQSHSWAEGETFIFDDTHPHEVWNDTPEERVILLVQFNRPLRLPGRILGAGFQGAIRWSPFVQEGRRNLIAWEKRYREAENLHGN